MPPVLKILDDIDVSVKSRGCELLDAVLQNTSPTLLKRTGLGPVFKESLAACTSYLPSLTPADIFIAVSSPSICGDQYCCCNSTNCRLDKYKITIFVERREQGRRVTRPWVRASSTESFEDAVNNLMATAEEMIKKVEPGLPQIGRSVSSTCLVEVLLDTQEA